MRLHPVPGAAIGLSQTPDRARKLFELGLAFWRSFSAACACIHLVAEPAKFVFTLGRSASLGRSRDIKLCVFAHEAILPIVCSVP